MAGTYNQPGAKYNQAGGKYNSLLTIVIDPANATAALLVDSPSASGAGSAFSAGSVALSLGAVTASGTAFSLLGGVAALQLDGLVVDGTAVSIAGATGSIILPISITETVQAVVLSHSESHMLVGPIAATGDGAGLANGQPVHLTIPLPTTTGQGGAVAGASGSAVLGPFVATATAKANSAGHAELVLDLDLTVEGHAIVPHVGNAALTLSPVSVVADAHSFYVDIDVELTLGDRRWTATVSLSSPMAAVSDPEWSAQASI